MAKQEFVVVISGTSMYLTGYNIGVPANSVFGNLKDAVIYTTLADANTAAANIGAGTVGTTKP